MIYPVKLESLYKIPKTLQYWRGFEESIIRAATLPINTRLP